MLEIFVTLILLSISSIFYGQLLARFIFPESENELLISDYGILGMIFLTLVAMAWHIFWPINLYFTLALHVFAWVAAAYLWFKTNRRLRLDKKQVYLILIGMGLSMILAYKSFISSPVYDTGLYHLQTIRWQLESPLAIGLVNLHGRLALNSNWLVLASALNIWPNSYLAIFAINGVLTLIILWGFLQNLIKKDDSALLSKVTAAILASLLLVEQLTSLNDLGGPNNDYPIIVLTYYLLFVLFRIFEKKKFFNLLAFLIIYLIFLVTIKLSALPMVLFLAILWLKRRDFDFQKDARKFQKVLILAGVFMLLWLARSIMASGCLIFPVTSTCAHGLSWAASGDLTNWYESWIKSWARLPGLDPSIVLASSDWLSVYWLKTIGASQTFFYFKVIFGLGVVANALAFMLKEKFLERELALLITIFDILIVCLVYWFVTVPDLRFGTGYLLSLALLIVFFGTYLLAKKKYFQILITRLPFLVMILTLLVVLKRTWQFRSLLTESWPRLPQTEEPKTRQTPDGQTVYVPSRGDQCFDLPIPCTPYFKKDLQFKIMNHRYFFFSVKTEASE